MKCVLKYILPILCLVLYVNSGIYRHTADAIHTQLPATNEAVVDAPDTNKPLAELCNQRTSHLETLLRIPSNTRRADTESRHNISYLKAGKIIHTGIYYTTYNHIKLRNAILSEPSHRLICLGKLII